MLYRYRDLLFFLQMCLQALPKFFYFSSPIILISSSRLNPVLINDYQEKKDIEAKLKTKITAYEKRRDSLSQAFQLDVKAAEVKARSMSQANLQKLQQEFQQKEQVISQQLQFEQQQIAAIFVLFYIITYRPPSPLFSISRVVSRYIR